MHRISISISSRSSWIIILSFFVILTLILIKLIVTDESLWIDEFSTEKLANVNSISQWWNQLKNWTGSERQMPLYCLYIYGWIKAFGSTEYAMRMANLPLFLAAEIIIFWTFRRNLLFALSALTLSSIHPLLWYYLNEARPYILTYLGSTLMTITLVQLYFLTRIRGESLYSFPSAWLFTLGIILLAGSSMLGMPWAMIGIGLGAYMLFTGENGKSWLIKHKIAVLTMLITLSMLGAYYYWTLLRGAGGTTSYESNIKTLIFSFYELFGLSGIGPGRLELREIGVSTLSGYFVQLAIGSIILLGVFFYSIITIMRYLKIKDSLIFLIAILLPILFTLSASYIMHWRPVGRHYLPILPAIILIMSYGVSILLSNSQVSRKAIALSVLIVMAVSAISMKLPRHAKDDYKSAAIFTNEALASGHTVWWVALTMGADYYKVPFFKYNCSQPVPEKLEQALSISNVEKTCVENLELPDFIVLSKPNDFDRRGGIREIIKRGRFQLEKELPAFTIWRKPD